jgi:hypothetical protein
LEDHVRLEGVAHAKPFPDGWSMNHILFWHLGKVTLCISHPTRDESCKQGKYQRKTYHGSTFLGCGVMGDRLSGSGFANEKMANIGKFMVLDEEQLKSLSPAMAARSSHVSSKGGGCDRGPKDEKRRRSPSSRGMRNTDGTLMMGWVFQIPLEAGWR